MMWKFVRGVPTKVIDKKKEEKKTMTTKKKPVAPVPNYVTTVEKPVTVTLTTKGAAINGEIIGRDDAAQTIEIALVPWSSTLSNESRCVELVVTDQYNNTVSVVVEGETLVQSLRDLLDSDCHG